MTAAFLRQNAIRFAVVRSDGVWMFKDTSYAVTLKEWHRLCAEKPEFGFELIAVLREKGGAK